MGGIGGVSASDRVNLLTVNVFAHTEGRGHRTAAGCEGRLTLLFDWWAKRELGLKEDKLKKCIYQDLSFLFSDWGAKFVPNEDYSSKSGVVHATLEVGQLRLRAVSFRDGFYMEVTAAHAPKQWEEVSTVLQAIQAAPQVPTHLPISILAPLLRLHLGSLERSLSELNYAATWRAIQALKDVEREEYAQQMEKRVQDSRITPDHNISVGGGN